jgi:hypothetical protein
MTPPAAYYPRRRNAPKKKKGKRKKADGVTKTANQKGKGAASGINFQFFPLAAFIYPCLFAPQLKKSRLPFLSCSAFFVSFPFLLVGAMLRLVPKEGTRSAQVLLLRLLDGISNWGRVWRVLLLSGTNLGSQKAPPPN